MSSRFKLNRAGLNELANRTETGRAMEQVAEVIVDKARSNSRMRGAYYRRWAVLDRAQVDGTAGARAGTKFPFAHLEEWGSINNSPYAPMRRAVDQLRLRLDKAAKR